MIQLDRTREEQAAVGLDLANEAAGDTAMSIDKARRQRHAKRKRQQRYLHVTGVVTTRFEEDRSRTLRDWLILLAMIGAGWGMVIGMVWALLIYVGVLH